MYRCVPCVPCQDASLTVVSCVVGRNANGDARGAHPQSSVPSARGQRGRRGTPCADGSGRFCLDALFLQSTVSSFARRPRATTLDGDVFRDLRPRLALADKKKEVWHFPHSGNRTDNSGVHIIGQRCHRRRACRALRPTYEHAHARSSLHVAGPRRAAPSDACSGRTRSATKCDGHLIFASLMRHGPCHIGAGSPPPAGLESSSVAQYQLP